MFKLEYLSFSAKLSEWSQKKPKKKRGNCSTKSGRRLTGLIGPMRLTNYGRT